MDVVQALIDDWLWMVGVIVVVAGIAIWRTYRAVIDSKGAYKPPRRSSIDFIDP